MTKTLLWRKGDIKKNLLRGSPYNSMYLKIKTNQEIWNALLCYVESVDMVYDVKAIIDELDRRKEL